MYLTPGMSYIYLPGTTYFSAGNTYYVDSNGDAKFRYGTYTNDVSIAGSITNLSHHGGGIF